MINFQIKKIKKNKKKYQKNFYNFNKKINYQFILNKLINLLMKHGKKTIIIKKINYKINLKIFEKAIINLYPIITKKKIKNNLFLPKICTKFQGITLSLHWLINSAKKRKDSYNIVESLKNEIEDAYFKVGLAYLEKIKHYKLIIENKKFLKKEKSLRNIY